MLESQDIPFTPDPIREGGSEGSSKKKGHEHQQSRSSFVFLQAEAQDMVSHVITTSKKHFENSVRFSRSIRKMMDSEESFEEEFKTSENHDGHY